MFTCIENEYDASFSQLLPMGRIVWPHFSKIPNNSFMKTLLLTVVTAISLPRGWPPLFHSVLRCLRVKSKFRGAWKKKMITSRGFVTPNYLFIAVTQTHHVDDEGKDCVASEKMPDKGPTGVDARLNDAPQSRRAHTIRFLYQSWPCFPNTSRLPFG